MFITPENLNIINLEFTDYCNAACPMCARFTWDGSLYKQKVNQNHNRLEVLKKNIPESIVRQLKRFYSTGTYGDATMNPECVEIYRWIHTVNPGCGLEMHSNGGARDTEFWKALGNLGLEITFGIDGLHDTNHIYRRNVKWDKLMNNVSTFISSGGKAKWKYLIFKHNQHQVDDAKKLSKEMGFLGFGSEYSDRWKSSNWVTGETLDVSSWPAGNNVLQKPDEQENKFYHDATVGVYKEQAFNRKSPVICKMASNNNYEVYIRANGHVQPCCMLGDIDVHEAKELIQDFDSVNINKTPLPEILRGEFFRKLDKGISGAPDNDRLKNCFYTCGVRD